MSKEFLDFFQRLSFSGLEPYNKYYGSYPGIVENYYPENDRIDVRVEGLVNGANLLKGVRFCTYQGMNIPLKKGDRVIVEFMWGNIDMGIARFSYHFYNEKDGKTTKDSSIVSSDFFKIKTPNGTFIEEIDKGCKITFDKSYIVIKDNVISIGNGEVELELSSDFTVTKKNGVIKLDSGNINKAIDANKLVILLNKIIALYNSHTHPVDGQAAVITPNLFVGLATLNGITLSDIFIG